MPCASASTCTSTWRGSRIELLDVDGRVGEVRLALALRRRERTLGLVGGLDHLQALAAAARRRLHRERPAVLVAEPHELLGSRHRIRRPRDDRNAGAGHEPPRLDLRAHRLDRLGRRADPDDPRLLARAGEGGVLREEPVAGMDRLGARHAAPRRGSARRSGSSRPARPGRRGTPPRRSGRAATRGRPPSRRRRCAIPSSRSVRKTRIAISPRFATRTFENGAASGTRRILSE